jgi:hypothetical protein
VTRKKRKAKKSMEHSAEIIQQTEQAAAPTVAAAWRVVGAAVPGVSHLRLVLPCQDVQAVRVLASGDLLVAMADGAGSARLSDQGAACAVDAALDALAARLEDSRPESQVAWELLLLEVFAASRQAVLALADEGQESAREYASTLTCVVVTADQLAIGQIGDGAVVGIDQDGVMFTATRLQRGEYANETHFITQNDALEQVVISVRAHVLRGVAVMSDGLIRLALKMPSQDPHEPFFQPLFRFVSALDEVQDAAGQLAAFMSSERVNSRTDDDKTLVLAVRTQEPAELVKAPDASWDEQAQGPQNGSVG